MSTVLSLCMIGCGNMGGALLRGWLDRLPGGLSVTVVKPSSDGLPEDSRIRYCPTLASLTDPSFDAVIWAVKPQVLPEVLPQWPQRHATLHLSVIAGQPIDYFHSVLGMQSAVIRSMPNTPATIGQGITALFAASSVTEAQRTLAEELLQAVGETVWLDEEEQMNAFTGLAGSGPAYLFYWLECLTAAGQAEGLPEAVARKAALHTLAGAAALAQQSPESAAELRRRVTSPNGTTAAGLTEWMDAASGLEPLTRRTIAAAARRSRELASR